MRIALVHDWLTGMRGGEKCLEVLCRRFPDARLFCLLRVPGATSPSIERMAITTSFLQRFPGVGRHYRYLLPLMPSAIERLRLPDDVDLVVSFSHAVAKSVKPPPGVPHVCYCFTPMRYAWSGRADYFAEQGRFRKTPLALVRNALLDWLRGWDRATSDRVTHFVAISQTVADRIAASYGRPSRIIYPPVDTRFYTPADASLADELPPEPYYLCVSALTPYKRIDLAIEACNQSRRRLLVIGAGPEQARLARLAGPTVQLAGWMDDKSIRGRLRSCRGLLFPGNEDFGIVPLEAQACGSPVVAFGQGGATETVLPGSQSKPGTGVFFDRQTPESLNAAMDSLESHPGWFDPRLARKQAERFAQERFERELVEFLEEVAGQESRPCLTPSPVLGI